MKTLTFILLAMITVSNYSQENISEKIVNLEKAALERWNNGDVYGFLELIADDYTYFDPETEKRIDGLEAITRYYLPLQGKIKINDSNMLNPKVQATENMAVLTFNLESKSEGILYRWNSTEVYRKQEDGNWKLIQSHWSYTRPEMK